MIDLRPHNDPKRLMDEAKDWAATCRQQEAEIERLRAEVNQLERQLDAKQDAFMAQEARASQLEAAIEAWFRVVRGAESNFLNGTPTPPIAPTNLHYALIAALEAAMGESK